MPPRKRAPRAKSTKKSAPSAAPAAKVSREKTATALATPPDPAIVPQRKQAAERLDITPRQLGDWAKEDWFPPDGRTAAGWNVAAIRAARDAMGRKGSDAASEAKKLERALKREKLRNLRIENERRRREENEAQGNILPRDEYTLFAGEAITIARDRILAIPKALAKLVPKGNRKKLIVEGEREVRKILSSLAAVLAKGPTD